MITFGAIWAGMLGLREIKESKKSINFLSSDLIPASRDSSFSAPNLKENVFGASIYSLSVIVIAFVLGKL